MADVMVQHLVRWVESPASCLYDRALHFYVQMMSRKALLQLMADFRRVGSQIIFASANRLLLQTTKAEVGNAYAYSQYILKSIKAKPLVSLHRFGHQGVLGLPGVVRRVQLRWQGLPGGSGA